MTATTARSRTARKLIGSLGIVGAAAAVAGLGTFGTFTDSTTPLNATVNTGTLSITLTPANDTGSLSLSATNFVPGDSLSRTVDLTNDGTSAFSSLSLNSTASASNLLSTDTTNGLQLGVQSCSVTWTKTATGSYTCSGTTKTMVATGPAVATNSVLAGPASVVAGGVDHLMVTLSLPSSAGNSFQGLTNSLAVSFGGAQASGTAR
jgi:camelysin-like metallo-endopeptidase